MSKQGEVINDLYKHGFVAFGQEYPLWMGHEYFYDIAEVRSDGSVVMHGPHESHDAYALALKIIEHDDVAMHRVTRMENQDVQAVDSGRPVRPGGSSPHRYRRDITYRGGVANGVEVTDISNAYNLSANQYEILKANLRMDEKESPEYNLRKIFYFTMYEFLRRGLVGHEEAWQILEQVENLQPPKPVVSDGDSEGSNFEKHEIFWRD